MEGGTEGREDLNLEQVHFEVERQKPQCPNPKQEQDGRSGCTPRINYRLIPRPHTSYMTGKILTVSHTEELVSTCNHPIMTSSK